MIIAKVVYRTRTVEAIKVYDEKGNVLHHIEYGDVQDGYCYHHQDFDCNITPEEKIAINSADDSNVEVL